MFWGTIFTRALYGLVLITNHTGALPSASPLTVRDDVRIAVAPAGDPVGVDGGGVYLRTTVLRDGSIFGAYAAGDGTNRIIRTTRSSDGGATWQPLGTVASSPGATTDLDNPYPLELPNGEILVAFRNHDRTGSSYVHYRITVCVSSDGGLSWGFRAQVFERRAAGTNGLWEPFLRLAGDGSVQAYYSSEVSAGDQDNLMRWSFDGGVTWSTDVVVVSGGGVAARDGMIGVAPLGGGNLIAVFETTEQSPFCVNYVLSSNDGASWGSRTRLYTAAPGKEAGAPQVISVGGTIVVDFMTNEGTADPKLDGGEMKVVTSTDGGRTWSAPTVTGGDGSHWPGLQSLSATEFLVLNTADGLGMIVQRWTL